MSNFGEIAIRNRGESDGSTASVVDDKLQVQTKDTESLLMELIKNVQITNLHLGKITGEKFTTEDLEN